MPDIKESIRMCLNDIKVELTEEFDRNFERKGFFTAAWKKAQQEPGRGTLMVRSGSLRRSIHSRVTSTSITFYSEHPGSAIHNEGGEIVVTMKMKRYFWAKYYEAGGGRQAAKHRTGTKIYKRTSAIDELAEYYKNLALMKVGSLITIPRRQFIGNHEVVEAAIMEIIEENFEEYFNHLDLQK